MSIEKTVRQTTVVASCRLQLKLKCDLTWQHGIPCTSTSTTGPLVETLLECVILALVMYVILRMRYVILHFSSRVLPVGIKNELHN